MGGDVRGWHEDQAPLDGPEFSADGRDSSMPGFLDGQGSMTLRMTDDELYEMTNLSPRMTGLPMIVWVSPRGHARHDVRVKVSAVHGSRLALDDMAVVALRPEPWLVAGRLEKPDFALVRAWLQLNAETLLEFWEGNLDTGELLERLQRV